MSATTATFPYGHPIGQVTFIGGLLQAADTRRFRPVVLRVMGCAETGDLKLIDGVSVQPLDQLRREWLAEDGKQDGCA